MRTIRPTNGSRPRDLYQPTLRRTSVRQRRSAAVTLELILSFPLILAFTLIVIQSGLLVANLKHLDQAAFAGALLAASTPSADLPTAIGNVEARVNRVLTNSGLAEACRVVLQHNVPMTSNPCQSSGACGSFDDDCTNICDCPESSLPDLPAGDVPAVRVTVWILQTQLSPNLLTAMGWSLNGQTARTTVTLPFVEMP